MSRRSDRDVEDLLRGDAAIEPPSDLLDTLRAEIPEDFGSPGAVEGDGVGEVVDFPPAARRPRGQGRRTWIAAAAVLAATAGSLVLYRSLEPGAAFEGVAEQAAAPAIEASEARVDREGDAGAEPGRDLSADVVPPGAAAPSSAPDADISGAASDASAPSSGVLELRDAASAAAPTLEVERSGPPASTAETSSADAIPGEPKQGSAPVSPSTPAEAPAMR
ncbi:MAG: hypothetical protein AAGM22_20260, partial [Acidobacteriota bacterium]